MFKRSFNQGFNNLKSYSNLNLRKNSYNFLKYKVNYFGSGHHEITGEVEGNRVYVPASVISHIIIPRIIIF